MIFVTLGSQKFQFNRLLEAIDKQIEDKKIVDEVFAQIGASDYIPHNYLYKEYLNREEFSNYISNSEIVVTHGGTGVIMGAIKKGKKVIAIPRLKKYGEHVDDHQLQLINEFSKLELICECIDCDKLYEAVETAKKTVYREYKSNTHQIITSIEKFIEESEQMHG